MSTFTGFGSPTPTSPLPDGRVSVRHAHVDLHRIHIGSKWKDGKRLLESGNQSAREPAEPTAQCRNAPAAKSLASEGTADVLSLPRGPPAEGTRGPTPEGGSPSQGAAQTSAQTSAEVLGVTHGRGRGNLGRLQSACRFVQLHV